MKIDLITIRDEKRVKQSLEIPTSWAQVTFKQYLALHAAWKKGATATNILSVFTGLDESVILKAQIKNLSSVTACLSFIDKPIQYLTPKSILGHRVVNNLDTQSIAQFEDLRSICATFTEDQEFNQSLFPLIVATYAVRPYDFKEAEYLAPKFLNAPCTEVLAIGNFTWARLAALKSGIVPTSPQADSPLNRFKQDLINWLTNLASSIRYHTWKRSLGTNERNYLNGR